MHNWFGATLLCVVLSVPAYVHAAALPPVPENPRPAQTAWRFNLETRCPDLRITDVGTKAVVVFWLSSHGTPSHISVRSSSGSIRARNYARQRRSDRLVAADCLDLGNSRV